MQDNLIMFPTPSPAVPVCANCGMTARDVNNIRSNGMRHGAIGWIWRNPDVVCCQSFYTRPEAMEGADAR